MNSIELDQFMFQLQNIDLFIILEIIKGEKIKLEGR